MTAESTSRSEKATDATVRTFTERRRQIVSDQSNRDVLSSRAMTSQRPCAVNNFTTANVSLRAVRNSLTRAKRSSGRVRSETKFAAARVSFVVRFTGVRLSLLSYRSTIISLPPEDSSP